jgi:hypothetical protein
MKKASYKKLEQKVKKLKKDGVTYKQAKNH